LDSGDFEAELDLLNEEVEGEGVLLFIPLGDALLSFSEFFGKSSYGLKEIFCPEVCLLPSSEEALLLLLLLSIELD